MEIRIQQNCVRRNSSVYIDEVNCAVVDIVLTGQRHKKFNVIIVPVPVMPGIGLIKPSATPVILPVTFSSITPGIIG